jgi:structural maintenance of chromosome 3 (chondroitin sulfate proteoglycan 6)
MLETRLARRQSHPMHIKRITIQGFKTYKNTTVVDLLSPHHNVVVGRNGLGKLNFFAAIRFVLSDAYTHMTREERQGLIHEGSGTVMLAYVEIVFDNAERRLPVAKDEVAVRRTIGLKKDDYSLDMRSSTRSDIMNLLESAGFSRLNPYYIVPQGRITALTNSKDAERLTLLKEVSGAKVFEAKLKESMREMSLSMLKKQRIDETLALIEERLSDLQTESSDLQEFQALEKKKRVYEFQLFDRELSELAAQLEEHHAAYEELLAASAHDLEELDQRERLGRELAESIEELQRLLKVAALDKLQAQSDYATELERRTETEVKLGELQTQLTQATEQARGFEANLEHYRLLIQQREAQIAALTPQLEQQQQREHQIKAKLTQLQTRQRMLYSKQTRFSQYRTKAERDQWVQLQIEQKQRQAQDLEAQIAELGSAHQRQSAELQEVEARIAHLQDSILGQDFESALASLQAQIDTKRAAITELNDRRKTLWRDEMRLKSIHDSLQDELNKAAHLVSHTMDRSQAAGLEALEEITKRLKLEESVLGPLAGLFQVSDKYKTSVEVTAGNALFHVVVDNDHTAALLMTELNRSQSGRVSIMPLNRIGGVDVRLPDNMEELQCLPLIKKLKYKDERVVPALRQVFGKTLLVANLERGAEIAKNFKVNCITLDGDSADNRGILTGGYRDYKRSSSRLDAIKTLSKKRLESTANNKMLSTCVADIEAINPQLTTLNNELQELVRNREAKLSSQEPIKAELSRLADQKFNLLQELETVQTSLKAATDSRRKLAISLELLDAELKSEFTHSLTAEETAELAELMALIANLEDELDLCVMELMETETTISTHQSDLTNNYLPYVERLKKENASSGQQKVEELKLQIERLSTTLAKVTVDLNIAETRLQAATDSEQQLKTELARNEDSLKKSKRQMAQLVKKLQKFQETSERELSKREVLVNRREEIQKKILDLGVLPEEAFQQEKFDPFSTEDLLKKLNTVNDKLSRFSHINKKALEQYNTFTKQKNELVQRLEELEASKESIESLIANLESQKDAAITNSFKQVADSFASIFEKLVPRGSGSLIMQGAAADATGAESYTGVAISVSFNSKSDDQQRIEQLSGGQKSLCAIALILAIQTCDPAPFYLFDEIDANLDTQYRAAVATMISSLLANAQFICTTFRPEMLQVADKFYGVMYNDKMSSISEINRDEATSFVESQRQS